MENAPAPAEVFGFDVFDSASIRIGTVDNVWVDDATGALEFVGVKTGWLFGRTHLIPTAMATIKGRTLTVPFTEAQIRDAPSFAADHELTPEEEEAVYRYYGAERPGMMPAPEPSAAPGDQAAPDAGPEPS